jgi:hypothetical protein
MNFKSAVIYRDPSPASHPITRKPRVGAPAARDSGLQKKAYLLEESLIAERSLS